MLEYHIVRFLQEINSMSLRCRRPRIVCDSPFDGKVFSTILEIVARIGLILSTTHCFRHLRGK